LRRRDSQKYAPRRGALNYQEGQMLQLHARSKPLKPIVSVWGAYQLRKGFEKRLGFKSVAKILKRLLKLFIQILSVVFYTGSVEKFRHSLT
jgi:hypothetical protein